MNQSTLAQFEGVDAAFFSGDLLYTDLEAVKDYLARWQRAVDAHVQSETRFGIGELPAGGLSAICPKCDHEFGVHHTNVRGYMGKCPKCGWSESK